MYSPGMARPISRIELTESERQELRRRVNAPSVSKRDSLRAEIILRRASGIGQVRVAQELGVSAASVNKWSQRFARDGLNGLKDQKGRGRRPSIPAEKVQQVITKATQPKPPRTRWSVRTMAKEVGISPDSVHRIWQANDIKPHIVETFKLSNDPAFEEKLVDVVGLYLNPPEDAVVLSVDEKSQVQALARSQPAFPMMPSERSAPRPTTTHGMAPSRCLPH